MALAMKNPLPNGLYTMDLPTPTSSSSKDGVAVLAAWTKANQGKVVVQKVTVQPEPGRTSVLFEVIGPPGAFPFGLGYPTIVPSSTTTGDTEEQSELGWLALLYVLWKFTKRGRC
jgi:hypothetical protein